MASLSEAIPSGELALQPSSPPATQSYNPKSCQSFYCQRKDLLANLKARPTAGVSRKLDTLAHFPRQGNMYQGTNCRKSKVCLSNSIPCVDNKFNFLDVVLRKIKHRVPNTRLIVKRRVCVIPTTRIWIQPEIAFPPQPPNPDLSTDLSPTDLSYIRTTHSTRFRSSHMHKEGKIRSQKGGSDDISVVCLLVEIKKSSETY